MKLTRSYTHGDRIVSEHMRDVADALDRVLEVELVEAEIDPGNLPLEVRTRRVRVPRSVVVGNVVERDDPSAAPSAGAVVWDRYGAGLRVRGLGGSLSSGTVYRVTLRVEGD